MGETILGIERAAWCIFALFTMFAIIATALQHWLIKKGYDK